MRKLIPTLALAVLLVGVASQSRAADDKKSEGVKPGDMAPQFALQDHNGNTVNLNDYKGKIVVLEWFNNECPFVQRHYKLNTMNTLADKYKGKDVVWLAINSTKEKTNDNNKAIAAEWNLNHPILNDSDGQVGHMYGATNTPHMFIIDKDGKIAYMGGIDSEASEDLKAPIKEGTVNYVDKALGELLDGKPVSEPQTKQYGCSVKYAK